MSAAVKQAEASSAKGRLPNLVVIGAQKAGTSWLHWRMARHPNILMSRVKELDFFKQAVTPERLAEYRAHFPVTEGKTYYGESSPFYFWTPDPESPYSRSYRGHPDIPGALKEVLGPDTRLLVSLRHPVDRAVSSFFHQFKRGRTEASDRLNTLGPRLGVIDMGFYKRHWTAWARVFGDDAFIVILFDAIQKDPQGVFADVLNRLGLPPMRMDVSKAVHAGFNFRLKDGALEINADDEWNRTLAEKEGCDLAKAPKVYEEDVAFLNELYAEDIAFVQERWGNAANVDWTAPRRLSDLLDDEG
jgi:hypothetical protein